MKRKEYLNEAVQLIKEEIRHNLFLNYKIEIPKGVLRSLSVLIKNPMGIIKEYDLQPNYSRYRLTHTSVNNSISELKETIVRDIEMLEKFKEYSAALKQEEDDFELAEDNEDLSHEEL